MGMFDWVRSSYNLGPQFTDVELQTKDIDNLMNHYWIAPDGILYVIDYSHTADFVELQEGDEGYNDTHKLFNFRWIPNGVHGKVSPVMITKYIEVYPAEWKGKWEDWPRLKLHLKYGRVVEYEDITGHR